MRKKRVIEVISPEFNDQRTVVGIWIKTENRYREELHVLYKKILRHDRDQYYFPIETPTIEIVHCSLPQVFKLTKRDAFEIDYPLRRRCFLLAWKALWPNYSPPEIVKKRYYGVILSDYKKGIKPPIYFRNAVSEKHAKKIIGYAYNQERKRPSDQYVVMRAGEVKHKKKKKQKPRTLFHEGGERK